MVPGYFSISREQHRLYDHRAAAILQSASVPSAMLSGDATALQNIDHWSWELGAHALSIATAVGWIAEALLPRGGWGHSC